MTDVPFIHLSRIKIIRSTQERQFPNRYTNKMDAKNGCFFKKNLSTLGRLFLRCIGIFGIIAGFSFATLIQKPLLLENTSQAQPVINLEPEWFNISEIFIDYETIFLNNLAIVNTPILKNSISSKSSALVPPRWEIYLPIAVFPPVFLAVFLLGIHFPKSSKKKQPLIIKKETLKTLMKAHESIYQINQVEQGYQHFLDICTQNLHADAAVVFLWDEQQKMYLPEFSKHIFTVDLDKLWFDKNHPNLNRLFKYRLPLVINKLKNKPFNTLFPDYVLAKNVQAMILLTSAAQDDENPPIYCAFYQYSDFIPNEMEILYRNLVGHVSLSVNYLHRLEQTRKDAIYEERKRLARDLHDCTKQKTFAALTQLGIAHLLVEEEAKLYQPIHTAEDLLFEAIEELNFILHEICPKALLKNNIHEAIRAYLRYWEQTNKICTHMSFIGEEPLPKEIEITLYRITQEAFANIARHSTATQAKFTFTIGEEDIQMVIEDNGVGFNPLKEQDGMGLQSMHQRLIPFMGRLSIHSVEGLGTQLAIIIPKPEGI